jgi:hypothetical protein
MKSSSSSRSSPQVPSCASKQPVVADCLITLPLSWSVAGEMCGERRRSASVRGENLAGDEILERRERGLGKLELDVAPPAFDALGVEQLMQIRAADLSSGRLGEQVIQFVEVGAIILDWDLQPRRIRRQVESRRFLK